MIRSRDVDNLDFRVGNQHFIAAVTFQGAKLFGFALPRFFIAPRHRHDIDISKTPHRIEMMRPDKTGSDDSNAYSFVLSLFLHWKIILPEEACGRYAPIPPNIATVRSHVNLGFCRGAALSDPNRVLEGEGKTMRHVKFRSEPDVKRPFVRRYIRAAIEQLEQPAKGLNRKRTP